MKKNIWLICCISLMAQSIQTTDSCPPCSLLNNIKLWTLSIECSSEQKTEFLRRAVATYNYCDAKFWLKRGIPLKNAFGPTMYYEEENKEKENEDVEHLALRIKEHGIYNELKCCEHNDNKAEKIYILHLHQSNRLVTLWPHRTVKTSCSYDLPLNQNSEKARKAMAHLLGKYGVDYLRISENYPVY